MATTNIQMRGAMLKAMADASKELPPLPNLSASSILREASKMLSKLAADVSNPTTSPTETASSLQDLICDLTSISTTLSPPPATDSPVIMPKQNASILYGVCPYSLTNGGHCLLRRKCKLNNICLAFTEKVLNPATTATCSTTPCSRPHVRLSCPYDFNVQGGNCMIARTKGEGNEAWEKHMKLYAHKNEESMNREELDDRKMLSEMVEKHLKGEYTEEHVAKQ